MGGGTVGWGAGALIECCVQLVNDAGGEEGVCRFSAPAGMEGSSAREGATVKVNDKFPERV